MTPSTMRKAQERIWSATTRSELSRVGHPEDIRGRCNQGLEQVDLVAVHALHHGGDTLRPMPVSTEGFGRGCSPLASRLYCMNSRFR